MQKCLHSRHRRIKKLVAVLYVVVITALLVYLCRPNYEKYSVDEVPDTRTMYTLMSDDVSGNHENVDNNKSVEDVKMNNMPKNNSKNDIVLAVQDDFQDYDGMVNVLFEDGSVRNMKLEEYVYGCLVGEMPLNFHTQALMAQGVAIRSFTINKVLFSPKHKNAHVCTKPSCCQKYVVPEKSGYDESMLAMAHESVNATKGIVAVSDGKPINAVYHASSGITTKDSVEVWGGDVSYLKSVDSPVGEKEINELHYGGNGGHGVGMSQQGANLLAKQGKSYAQILCYYYSGIRLDSINYL